MKKLLLLCLFCILALPAGAATQAPLTPQKAEALAERAYIFGYPLLIMETSKSVISANDNNELLLNRFNHAQTFPDASFTDVVSPNADTLYTQAWLDLDNNAVMLTFPAMPDRYYVMQFMDAWSNVFASIGSRTSGSDAITFVVAGPNWQGPLPQDIGILRSPTSTVWMVGRVQTNGSEDYAAVHAIQEQMRIRTLGGDEPAMARFKVDNGLAPVAQMDTMDALTFFSLLNQLMATNPPASIDELFMREIAAIGIVPGQTFDPETLPPEIWAAIQKGFAKGHEYIAEDLGAPESRKNGVWDIMPENIGHFGADYTLRAYIAHVGLGANVPEDAIYPSTRHDADGEPLNGAHKYVIHFENDELPPVKGFWSITMYNDRQFFVENPVNRYAIGDRDDLKLNGDGSLTIYVQNAAPGKELESNWLPAPKGDFNLIMRLYWPEEPIVNNTWPAPALKRMD